MLILERSNHFDLAKLHGYIAFLAPHTTRAKRNAEPKTPEMTERDRGQRLVLATGSGYAKSQVNKRRRYNGIKIIRFKTGL